MGYNEIAKFASENPRISTFIGGGVMLTVGLIVKSLHKLLTSNNTRTYRSYPEPDRDDPRMGNGGAGMPAIPGLNDEYFQNISEEFKNGKYR